MNPDLLRQRRNLILVSLWLLVFEFAHVKIGKINVLGTELFVGNPKALIILGWLMWGYFFLRYYQYWRAENKQRIRDAFKTRLDNYANAYASRKKMYDPAGKLSGFRIYRTGLLKWCYAHEKYNPTTGYPEEHHSPSLPLGRMLAWTAKSAISTALNTTHATDHLLPFVLAIAAPLVAILRIAASLFSQELA